MKKNVVMKLLPTGTPIIANCANYFDPSLQRYYSRCCFFKAP